MLETHATVRPQPLTHARHGILRALITQSALQHTDQLARALYEAGELAQMWSGIPLAGEDDGPRWYYRFMPKLRLTTVPSVLRRHYPVFPGVRRFGCRMLTGTRGRAFSHAVDHAFDHFVAPKVAAVAPRMVISYENCALHTFRAAKRIGATCVLDAASIHYLTAADLFKNEIDPDPDWVTSQKQQEIELADAILTCSEFAADTYADNGVIRDKLFPCLLGTELPVAQGPDLRRDGPVRFVFVGTMRRLKAVDILLDIFDDFGKRGIPAELTLIGSVADQDLARRGGEIASVQLMPFISKPELFDVLASHDCLILPSRFDSFGMVVPEAMAVGLPAIVSDRVGSKIIIEKNPATGWVVPFGADGLRDKILELVGDRSVLQTAGEAAFRASRNYSWARYRINVVEMLRDIQHRATAKY